MRCMLYGIALIGDSSEDQVVIKTTKVIEKASTTGLSCFRVIEAML